MSSKSRHIYVISITARSASQLRFKWFCCHAGFWKAVFEIKKLRENNEDFLLIVTCIYTKNHRLPYSTSFPINNDESWYAFTWFSSYLMVFFAIKSTLYIHFFIIYIRFYIDTVKTYCLTGYSLHFCFSLRFLFWYLCLYFSIFPFLELIIFCFT